MIDLNIDWIFRANDIDVHWTADTNGGGTRFVLDYMDYFKTHCPNKTFNNALEWCAGPGFIGFSMLSSDICNNMSFLEMYEPSCDLMNKTIKNSNVNNATVIQADNVDVLTGEYDLIVGNPPHFRKYNSMQMASGHGGLIDDKKNWVRLAVDIDYTIHREFFTNIKNNMTEDCVILLLENTLEVFGISQVANECGFIVKNKYDSITSDYHNIIEVVLNK